VIGTTTVLIEVFVDARAAASSTEQARGNSNRISAR
jgi:hypothetical protein